MFLPELSRAGPKPGLRRPQARARPVPSPGSDATPQTGLLLHCIALLHCRNYKSCSSVWYSMKWSSLPIQFIPHVSDSSLLSSNVISKSFALQCVQCVQLQTRHACLSRRANPVRPLLCSRTTARHQDPPAPEHNLQFSLQFRPVKTPSVGTAPLAWVKSWIEVSSPSKFSFSQCQAVYQV